MNQLTVNHDIKPASFVYNNFASSVIVLHPSPLEGRKKGLNKRCKINNRQIV